MISAGTVVVWQVALPNVPIPPLLDSIRKETTCNRIFYEREPPRMATPPELMQAVSEATGVALPTVVDMDRRLVKAKLRTKGGRGLNAARMTALDAARLLTAVLASPQSNRAAEAVQRHAQTKPDKARSSEKLFAVAGLEDLAGLPVSHSFEQGLAALIASAAMGSLAKFPPRSFPHIEVFAFTQATHGRIRISDLPGGITASVEYVARSSGEGTRGGKAASGDLEQSRRITERTILPVARLFAEKRHERQ
jgi:hypothetical protein